MKLKIEKTRMRKCNFFDEDHDIGKKGNADGAKPKSKEGIMLYCDLGFKTVSVHPEIWSHVKQDGKEAQVDAFGVLYGRKEGTDIKIDFSFRLNPDVNGKRKIFDFENFYDSTKMEFLGFYSYGKIPNDNDVEILEKIFKNCKSSLFLLKVDLSQKSGTLSATMFECYKNFRNDLWLLQLHNHPECEGPINGSIDKDILEATVKIFYIDFGVRGFHRCKTLTEEDKQKIKENRLRLQRNVKKMNWRSKIIMHLRLWLPLWDYVELLNEFKQQSKFEATCNFRFHVGGSVHDYKLFSFSQVHLVDFTASSSGLSMEDNLQSSAEMVLSNVMRR